MTLVKDLPLNDPARGDAQGRVPASLDPNPGMPPGPAKDKANADFYMATYGTPYRPGSAPPPTAATSGYDAFGNPLGSPESQATNQQTGQWLDRIKNPVAQKALTEQQSKVDMAAGVAPLSKSADIDAAFKNLMAVPPPIAPTVDEQLSKAREASGLTSAQDELASANNELRQFEAKLLSEKGKIQSTPGLTRAYIGGELQSLDAQTAESYRQAQIRVQNASDRVQAANQQMSQIIQLTGQAYQNARQAYEFEQNKAFQFLQMFQTQKNREEDKAQAQVTAFLNIAKDAPDFLDKTTSADRVQWGTWENAAGLPQGYVEGLLKVSASIPSMEFKGTVGDAEHGYSSIMFDKKTGKVITTKIVGGMGPGGKTLSISEVKSYNEQFPRANVLPGDTEKIANEKVTKFGGVSTVNLPEGAPNENKNRQAILDILKSSKVQAGTKTKISDALNVMNAVEDFAKLRQTQGFQGISPLNAILDIKIPWTDIGIVPFRESARSNAGRENSGYIEAINLKVQQWASGAALTTAQTNQVNKFTPTTSDTDEAVRTKLNNLYNFMLTQVQGNIQSEGIDFSPQRTDLFELYGLIQKATPEQLKELKDAGFIK